MVTSDRPSVATPRKKRPKYLPSRFHLRRILVSYFAYYHRARTHLALDKYAPAGRPVERSEAGRIVEIPEVGGLHYRYVRQAA
jgi:hypothetical protein